MENLIYSFNLSQVHQAGVGHTWTIYQDHTIAGQVQTRFFQLEKKNDSDFYPGLKKQKYCVKDLI